MTDPGAIGALQESVRITLQDLERLINEIRSVETTFTVAAKPVELFGAGALIHGYYTHLERLFERVARDFNSAPPAGPEWHRHLLRAMALDKTPVRPAVVSEALARRLDELLRFRHLFRNLYVLDLDPESIGRLLRHALAIHPDVVAALGVFETFLGAVKP